MTRFIISAGLLALAGAPIAVAAVAQAPMQAAPSDADRLAAQMRLLANNPNDLASLLAAGELSVKLDDLGAAASFFARADKVDPRNGRAKAGEAAILVHAERPGEALRYFALAESYGLAPAAFAADRGLAYDLIGEQERAQRDYRLALRTPSAAGPDEETQRRYALSLAIAGKRDLAEQQLQPLLRRSDRGAWRVHAFILAMGGNVAEASRIATTMMPPGTAAGLQPFLERLPTLSPIDRAFAVHFGEVRSTPERLADARLVPPLPALAVDPYAPRLAAVAAAAPVADKGKRRKEKRGAVQVAVATPAPMPLPLPPTYRPAAGAPVVLATRGTAPTAWPTPVTSAPIAPMPPSRVTLAANRPTLPATAAYPAPFVAGPPRRADAADRTQVAAVTPPTRTPAPPVESNVIVGAPASVTSRAAAAPVSPPPVVVAPQAPAVIVASQPPLPVVTASSPIMKAAATSPATAVAPAAASTAMIPPPRPAPAALAPAVTLPVAAPVERVAVVQPRRDTSALAQIVASLPIPAAELGVAGPVRPALAPAPTEVDAAAQAAAERERERATAAKALADKRAADRKAAADKKALAEKKAAAEQKAEEAREAAAQKKLERANPERIWVQVAGGAREGDLPKAWAAAKAKGGDVFAGHSTGWTTPLRFTNRVLAGPFKSDEEARAFVNKLKGKGLSTFTFTSDAGQPVRKLDSE